ncbi:CaiB/BaiF CoA transferase family protein [Burkholderia glumae]|uniref:CoA transferase n=1 Tax=Burkholderia glumae TaxID=337 RepID=A0AAP9Y464_BURGL|nr:CaiB/BaiF CoA-transferase family protein [Burkholderia glumae]AJY63067.1 coA-transferase III family protein [Burkholderia glumae LMG 2196 = ATCC 33617]KHJ60270.1 CoA-transferase [Burkholderia glumae]MCM2484334.1 CoA transferase [Burkholderia glumae]MCM2510026.1 CoA transferase [Burkholderia glumae]MCM2539787.1 CoA transferase [Burkholderia glumae]
MNVAMPLAGVEVLELEGLGPAPLAGWMLAALGARVTLVARPGGRAGGPPGLQARDGDLLREGKTVVECDLKAAGAREAMLDRIARADVLIEGYRPGVMERLGLGPHACAARRPSLVYARMTGWGQHGPLAGRAGHDLNYVALTGLLALAVKPGQMPVIPPTVVGDAGGALGLAFGIVSALLAARASGRGRVVDGAIVDVVAMLGALALWAREHGQLGGPDGASLFHDAPFYAVYRCADGAWISVAALEPAFYRRFVAGFGLDGIDPEAQYARETWPALKTRFAAHFASAPAAFWCERFADADACVAPVLDFEAAARHPHNRARGVHALTPDGALRVKVAPRFTWLDDEPAACGE